MVVINCDMKSTCSMQNECEWGSHWVVLRSFPALCPKRGSNTDFGTCKGVRVLVEYSL